MVTEAFPDNKTKYPLNMWRNWTFNRSLKKTMRSKCVEKSINVDFIYIIINPCFDILLTDGARNEVCKGENQKFAV